MEVPIEIDEQYLEIDIRPSSIEMLGTREKWTIWDSPQTATERNSLSALLVA